MKCVEIPIRKIARPSACKNESAVPETLRHFPQAAVRFGLPSYFNWSKAEREMIINLNQDDRIEHPALLDTMFRSRAAVFHDRLGWDVVVKDGHEVDRYDEEADPVYLLAVDDDQRVHQFSAVARRTTGPTMLQSGFASISSMMTWM